MVELDPELAKHLPKYGIWILEQKRKKKRKSAGKLRAHHPK